ncbi:TonB-dependent hemoglobin/transferrin/lactoferrin family receptor [Rhizobium glycinendophyticum]|uniref:TonB-dependent hemoglobin/transferrin/lactoferrin family receptor n=1 Tax=Rhizobium glycinendophyticum TaxID=2589807 RepID=A0A504USP2_9HYPH|nr:TonB-dependent hemoglobin/transferrin/lactoferrin family receptor [Rhizobium glycinendophyticum]TPP11696.1 TonB-dependent hemoglobin/transferrin/lactoferrin family receptor [Rhizobium glycinendophyticum]
MRSRSARPLLLACTALVAVSAIHPAHAQDSATPSTTTSDADETQLQTIVVKGKRVPAGSVADTPVSTTTDSKTLQKKQVDDVDDLGNTVEPSVTYVRQSKSVNIRGLEADRVLTTIDGIPVPYFFDTVYNYGGGADTYDFNSLSSVDVLHSADSSRAGSGALGGALLLNTLEPDDLLADGATFGGIGKLGYDGSDKSFTASGAIAKKIENTSVMFQSSYKKGQETETKGDVGGTRSTRTEADPLDYNQRNFLFKIRQDLEGGHRIGLTAEHYGYNSRKDYMSSSTYGTTYRAGDYDLVQEKDRDRVSLDYEFESVGDDSLIDSAAATVYWQRSARTEGQDSYRLTAPIGEYDRLMESEQRDIGFSGYANSDFATGSLNHQLTFGADFRFTQSSYYLSGVDSCSVTWVPGCAYYHTNQSYSPDVNSYRFGAYAEDKITLGNSAVSVTPGLRFDWYKEDPQSTDTFEGDMPEGQSGTRFSPKLRAAWQVKPDIELYAQFVTAFKAPNAYQLYVDYDNAPLYRSIGNPDLKPETSWGFDVGANLGEDDFGGRVSAFSTRYNNFIDTSDIIATSGYALGTYQFINRDNVRISGVELEAHKTFANGFNLHGSLAYARGTDLDSDELLASVPPLKAIVGFGYEQEAWGTDVSLVAASAVPDDSAALTKPDGYGVVNLTGWWEPEQFKGLRVQAGVYNLFDKKYFDALEVKNVSNASDIYSEAGRYFKVAISQKF